MKPISNSLPLQDITQLPMMILQKQLEHTNKMLSFNAENKVSAMKSANIAGAIDTFA